MEKKIRTFFKGVALGGIVGTVMGLFNAPKKGEELQRDAKKKVDELVKRATKIEKKAVKEGKKIVSKAKKAVKKSKKK